MRRPEGLPLHLLQDRVTGVARGRVGEKHLGVGEPRDRRVDFVRDARREDAERRQPLALGERLFRPHPVGDVVDEDDAAVRLPAEGRDRHAQVPLFIERVEEPRLDGALAAVGGGVREVHVRKGGGEVRPDELRLGPAHDRRGTGWPNDAAVAVEDRFRRGGADDALLVLLRVADLFQPTAAPWRARVLETRRPGQDGRQRPRPRRERHAPRPVADAERADEGAPQRGAKRPAAGVQVFRGGSSSSPKAARAGAARPRSPGVAERVPGGRRDVADLEEEEVARDDEVRPAALHDRGRHPPARAGSRSRARCRAARGAPDRCRGTGSAPGRP